MNKTNLKFKGKFLNRAVFFTALVMIMGLFSACPQNNPKPDKTPPAEVTAFNAVAGDGKVILSWTNPADEDLYQVEISASPSDGALKTPVYLAAAKGTAGAFLAEGLTNGTEYTFTVKTIDKALNVGKGLTVKAKPQASGSGGTADTTAPAEVTGLKAIEGTGKVSLSWTNPADEDLYQVEISASPSDGALKTPVYLAAAKGTAGAFLAEGLTNGTEYTFTVKTIDKALNVGKGLTVKAKPQASGSGSTADTIPPKEAANLKTDTGDGKISLRWTNPADEDLYQVEITASPAAGTLTNAVYLAAEKGKSMSFEVEGLTNGTAYTFTVKTIDKVLNKSTGAKTPAVTPIDTSDKTPPAEVTELKTVPGNGKISLSWTNPADEDLYQVEISASPAAGTLTNAVYLKAKKGETMSFTAEGLTNGTGYTFTVKTIDKALNKSTGAKTPTAVTPINVDDNTAPAEVTELKTVLGNGKISLSWTNPADEDLYQVEISVNPKAGTLANAVYLEAKKDESMSFEVEGLTNGTGYIFTVKTIDKVLNKSTGAKTPAVKPIDTSDKTPPAEVTNLQAEALAGAVRLTWTDPADGDLWGIEITSSEQIIAVRGVMHTEPLKPNTILAAKGQQSLRISNLTVGKPYTFTVKTIDLSGNKSAGIGTTGAVTPIAGEPMTLSLSQSPEKTVWTNGNVTISFTSSTSVKTARWAKGVKSAKDVLENGSVITERSFEVSENGIYSVAVQDNDGRREVETIQITNIDKTAPEAPINLTAEYKLSAKKIILRWIDPADTGSGLKELKLTYTVNGGNAESATIAKGVQIFELNNIEPQNPPHPYIFSLKGVDKAGNEGAEVSATAKPSEQAEVMGMSVSRKKIDKNDPDKKVTVTLEGSNLTKAEEIKITGSGTITCTNVTANSASAEFTLPEGVKTYTFRVSVKQAGAAVSSVVNGIEAKTQICEPAEITLMTVKKQDGTSFATDSYGALKIEAGTGGQMKVVLKGSNLDIDGAKAGVNFNGQNIDGIVNEAGTELTIENLEIPTESGAYPIRAQLKPRYGTEYIIVPDQSSYYGYKAQLLRVLGEAVLKELWLSGYDHTLEGSEGWLVIKGENLDTLTADELSSISSSLGAGVDGAAIKDSTTLEAKYIIPDLTDNSVIDKTEMLTIAGKNVSSPLHTLKIKKYDSGKKYEVEGYYSIPSDGNPRIPAYVDRIAYNAFRNCMKITNLDLSGCTKLTEIGYKAFSGCKELTSVSFPASLTKIDSSAFEGCAKLTGAELSGTKLTEIGGSAFEGCKELTSVSFPASLTKIDESAYSNCTSLSSISLSASFKEEWMRMFNVLPNLETITVDPANPVLCAEENIVYNREKTKVILAGKKITQVSLPSTITEIYNIAFYSCKELISISFPASLTKIGYSAFSGCAKLTGAELSGTKLTEIGGSAFYDCKELTSVSFPASLTKIDRGAFSGCAKLTGAELSGTKLTEIGGSAFYDCKELTSVSFPASLTKIDSGAFSGCSKLTSAVFADPVGWAAYDNHNYTGTPTPIQQSELETPATAAQYLRSTYNSKYWKKN